MPAEDALIEARAALRAAVITTSAHLLPGRGGPDGRHLALLAEATPMAPPQIWTDSSASVLTSLLSARARRDALSDGMEFIERYFADGRLRRPAQLSAAARSLLLSSAAEYCCALGWGQIASRFASEALLFAETDAHRYRAHGVSALGHAVNGEVIAAEEHNARARALADANGWSTSETDYALLLAGVLTAAARGDAARLRRITQELPEIQPDDPYMDTTSEAIAVMLNVIEKDVAAGLATSWRILRGSSRQLSWRMIRDFVVCMRSDLLVAQGEPSEALALLRHAETPAGHGICFHVQRAQCMLHLGRERDALAETEGCIAVESEDLHCLRTLVPLLLVRAVAFRRVGSERRARLAMESALLLIQRIGLSITPFVMLPLDDTLALIDDVVARRSELDEVGARIRAFLPDIAAPSSGHSGPPPLTPRERELAVMLATPLSLAQIARERRVSVNTVKSQVRSIYAKLGVGGRSEAVAEISKMSI